jgi:DNA-binding NarL/FixJ family response regulator
MKILLVDDHALFREGMGYVLEQVPGIPHEILEAENFLDGLELAGRHPDLDLALLDLMMADSEGPASIKTFHRSHPHIPIIVVSGEENCATMEESMNAGAMGFVCKNAAVPVMLDALNAVLSGEIYIPHSLLKKAHVQSGKKQPHPVQHNFRSNGHYLTSRQIEVLSYLASGLTSKEIAEKIDLTEGTVKVHISTIYRALGAKNRVEAIRIAVECKLLGGATHV